MQNKNCDKDDTPPSSPSQTDTNWSDDMGDVSEADSSKFSNLRFSNYPPVTKSNEKFWIFTVFMAGLLGAILITGGMVLHHLGDTIPDFVRNLSYLVVAIFAGLLVRKKL